MRRRRSAVALLALVALTGCSAAAEPVPVPEHVDLSTLDPQGQPGNGLWLLSGDAAVAEISQAIRAAGGVRYEGSFVETIESEDPEVPPTTGRSLDVAFQGASDRFSATVDAGTSHVEIVVADGLTYLRGNRAYADRTGIAEFAEGFVCTASAEALLAEWRPLLDPAALVEELALGADPLAVEPRIGDSETLTVVLGSGDAPVGRLLVEAEGAPLPRLLEAADTSGDGSFTFTGWGEPVAVEAPGELARPCR
ncbi:hypothetical protein [Agrococcus sp. KRD186]|uniref:hypothetical protein n=1 Tax=Agrococcus sp. KRD186 TaxID=2729730 RepID=UPI0019D22E41|nr:hypothetical protein [Agrococcus sp. KRD186]